MVVNNVCKVICRKFVGALIKNLVVKNIALYNNVAAYHVVNVNVLARLNLEAHYILVAVGYQSFNLFGRQCERVAHHHSRMGIILEVLYLLAFCLKLLGRVEGNVCLAGIEQLVDIFSVYRTTLALTVRTMLAAEADTLVKLNAKPSERLYDILLCARNKTV